MGKDAALAPLEKATSLLAQCRTVSDAVDIRDKARAAEVYAKQARLGLEAQNHAAEIKIRAERKAGELLAAMNLKEVRQENLKQKPKSQDVTSDVLADLGISKMQSHRWQKIAAVPEEKFREFVDETNQAGKELTSAALCRVVHDKPANGKPLTQKENSIAGLLVHLNEAIASELGKWSPGHYSVFCDRLRSLADEIEANGGLPE